MRAKTSLILIAAAIGRTLAATPTIAGAANPLTSDAWPAFLSTFCPKPVTLPGPSTSCPVCPTPTPCRAFKTVDWQPAAPMITTTFGSPGKTRAFKFHGGDLGLCKGNPSAGKRLVRLNSDCINKSQCGLPLTLFFSTKMREAS